MASGIAASVVASARPSFRVPRRPPSSVDESLLDALCSTGIRAVVFDFDLCVLGIHSYAEKFEVPHVRAREPLADDFVDLPFFRSVVCALAARGVRVAIASFGKYEVIQAYMDRAFPAAAVPTSAAAGGSGVLFTRDTISTPSRVGGLDGTEVAGGKNPQLKQLAEFFKATPTELLFFDGEDLRGALPALQPAPPSPPPALAF
jgi:hypothetical protein